MINREKSFYFWIIITFEVFISIILSIKFLDAGLAFRIMIILKSIRPLHNVTSNIPDILSFLVGGGTILMWIIYFYRAYQQKIDIKEKFLKLAATTLPVTYLLKTLLQISFGRTSPRDWLLDHEPLLFKGFNEASGGSFPSGHMAVFTAFGAAVLLYFPKYRKPLTIILVILGAALIGTDYHYLSDVIAGAYLGFIISYILWYLYEKSSVKQQNYL